MALCTHCTFLDMLTYMGAGQDLENFTRTSLEAHRPGWFVWSHEEPVSCVGGEFPQRAAGRRPVRTGPGPAARPRAQAAALPTSKMVLWWMEVVLQSGLPSPLHGALCRPREEKAVHSFLMFPVTRRVPLRRHFQSPI